MNGNTTSRSRLKRKRRRRDGRLVLQKGPDMRKNARTRKIHIVHGGNSRALRTMPFDKRTAVGKFSEAFKATLVNHVGGDPTAVEAEFIEWMAQDAILLRIIRPRLMRKNGHLDERALEQYLKVGRQLDARLRTLGLRRTAKQIPDLRDYIEGKAEVQEQ